jgi:hypothetical protein
MERMKIFGQEVDLSITTTEAQIMEVYDSIKVDENSSAAYYITLIPKICEAVEKIRGLTGNEKKKLALIFFGKIAIDKLHITQEDLKAKEEAASIVMDTIVLASKGKFFINQTVGFFKKFCPFCK